MSKNKIPQAKAQQSGGVGNLKPSPGKLAGSRQINAKTPQLPYSVKRKG